MMNAVENQKFKKDSHNFDVRKKAVWPHGNHIIHDAQSTPGHLVRFQVGH